MRRFVVTLLVLLAACTTEPTAVPTATPEPEVVAERAALAFKEITTLHFTLEQSGAPLSVDPSQTIAFRSAEGDFVAPDRLQATIKVGAGNLISEIQIVTIGDEGWMTNLFTGRWEALPAEWDLDPAALFEPETGIPDLLTKELQDVALAGPMVVEGLPDVAWSLSGRAQPGQLEAMSGGLIPAAPADVDLWIDPVSNLIYRMRVVLPESDPADPTELLLNLSHFDEAVTIEPPL
jgi:hypothetical protein